MELSIPSQVSSVGAQHNGPNGGLIVYQAPGLRIWCEALSGDYWVAAKLRTLTGLALFKVDGLLKGDPFKVLCHDTENVVFTGRLATGEGGWHLGITSENGVRPATLQSHKPQGVYGALRYTGLRFTKPYFSAMRPDDGDPGRPTLYLTQMAAQPFHTRGELWYKDPFDGEYRARILPSEHGGREIRVEFF